MWTGHYEAKIFRNKTYPQSVNVVYIFFVQQKAMTLRKCMDSLTLKRHNSFQNHNNRKAMHNFAPRPLIFKLQHEV